MARSSDGGWARLEESTPAMLTDLLTAVDDLDPLLGLGISAPIVADAARIPGSPDAVALTATGGILVVFVAGSSGEELGARLACTADSLGQDADLVVISATANRLGANDTLGTYVTAAVGTGDPRILDEAYDRALASSNIIYLVLCEHGHQHVAAQVLELERELGVEVHCIDAIQASTSAVHVVELVQVPRARLRASAQIARTHGERAQLVQAVHGSLGDSVGELLRTLLLHVDAFFAHVEHDVADDNVRLSAWLEHDVTAAPDLTIDSEGLIGFRLDRFSTTVRGDLMERLERICDVDGAQDEANVSLSSHLGDVSLVEQFVGALSDAQLRTASDDLRRDAA